MESKDNVIQFPKAKSLRARLIERSISQKPVLALSVLSVFMLSVFTNQILTRPHQESANRGLASYKPVTPEDLKWEHNLAADLSSRKGMSALLGIKPSLRDELIFGDLEGKYATRAVDGKVASIELIRKDGLTEPISIKDRAALLQKYGMAFSIPFTEVSLVSKNSNSETWSLIRSDKTIVGTAQIELDASGKFLSLEVK